MTRREFREHTFCMLFSSDFYSPEDAREEQAVRYIEGLTEMNEEDLDDRELEKLPRLSDEEKAELERRTKDIILHVEGLDEKINAVSEGWKTKRMSKVDLTLLRLALYEILYDDKVPVKVAINEAVEIAKKYGGPDSPSFVNGVLARLVK